MDFYTDDIPRRETEIMNWGELAAHPPSQKWQKSWGKSPTGKTCYAQTDRLVNSDNSTESPILKEPGETGKYSFSSIELELAHSFSTC